MYELKRLSRVGVDAALRKADRYRLLNEPWLAESICRDVLQVDPDNQQATIALILALSDQVATEGARCADEARALASQLPDEYARHYYSGIVAERRGMASLNRRTTGSGYMAHAALVEAMSCYERAEPLRPEGNEEALLRWNTCARAIISHPEVRPDVVEEPTLLQLE